RIKDTYPGEPFTKRCVGLLNDILVREPASWQNQTEGICIGVIGCETGSGASTVAQAMTTVATEKMRLETKLLMGASSSLRSQATTAEPSLDDRIAEIKPNVDLVILDLPAATQVNHPAVFCEQLDYIILVVAAEEAHEGDVRRSIDRFATFPAQLDGRPRFGGIVLNKCFQPIPKFIRRLAVGET
ncbi:MAG: hypothetical protein AAF989_17675, partial [Planctomycetota bacterium]